MSRPRVFVSFSSQDRELARRLFARLGAQPVDLWNYADEAEEIPGSADIPSYLKGQIDRSEWFLPLVTANSFGSNYARLEVEHALARARGCPLRIVPLIPANAPPPEIWPRPYSRLVSIRHRTADFLSRERLEALLVELCSDMQVPYLPLPTMDPRLPFMDRFAVEVERICAKREQHDRAVYQRLMRILAEFQQAFEDADFPLAYSRMAFFISMCEYEYEGERLYYPYVVKGVCEIALGRLREARETFGSLRSHARCDESVFGALGYICQQQGMYDEALEFYTRAARLDSEDAAAKTGVVQSSLLAGHEINIDRVFSEIESRPLEHEADRVKVRLLKAVALASAGRLAESLTEYSRLTGEGHTGPDVLVNHAIALVEARRPRDARDMLVRLGGATPEATVLHRAASLSFQIGDLGASLDLFKSLVERFPTVRQYRIDAAQALWRAGDRQGARAVCEPLIVPGALPLPASEGDFFCDGFANWFHGRGDRADYDFSRSRISPEKHYRNLVR
jgi:tetratricopeptide (TPR) repeat protein